MNKDEALAIAKEAKLLPDGWEGEPVDVLAPAPETSYETFGRISLAATLAGKGTEMFAALMERCYVPVVSDDRGNVFLASSTPLALVGENIVGELYGHIVSGLPAPKSNDVLDFLDSWPTVGLRRNVCHAVWRADRAGPDAGIWGLSHFYVRLYAAIDSLEFGAATVVARNVMASALAIAKEVLSC